MLIYSRYVTIIRRTHFLLKEESFPDSFKIQRSVVNRSDRNGTLCVVKAEPLCIINRHCRRQSQRIQTWYHAAYTKRPSPFTFAKREARELVSCIYLHTGRNICNLFAVANTYIYCLRFQGSSECAIERSQLKTRTGITPIDSISDKERYTKESLAIF